jgi:hypothetical protein
MSRTIQWNVEAIKIISTTSPSPNRLGGRVVMVGVAIYVRTNDKVFLKHEGKKL